MLQDFILFFERIKPGERLAIFISILFFFTLIEFIIPLRKNEKSRTNHVTINLFLISSTSNRCPMVTG